MSLRVQTLFACVLLGALALPARAQISPECAGVERPAGYDEAFQQANLQNYFAAAFLMTPLGPVLPYAPGRASIGLELGLIPPMSCEARLVLDGTKTEDTNKLPVNPRPRLLVSLPDAGPVSSFVGLTVVPPLPTPLGTILQVGAEGGVGWRSDFGLAVGVRGHINFARMRAEIATPFVPGDPAVDDLFFASILGGDVGVAYQLPWEPVTWLRPYASLGVGDVSTLFLVGDDLALVENTKHPWWGPTAALGVQGLFLGDHLEVVLEVSSAVPVFTTLKGKVALVW